VEPTRAFEDMDWHDYELKEAVIVAETVKEAANIVREYYADELKSSNGTLYLKLQHDASNPSNLIQSIKRCFNRLFQHPIHPENIIPRVPTPLTRHNSEESFIETKGPRGVATLHWRYSCASSLGDDTVLAIRKRLQTMIGLLNAVADLCN
jgi:hypothetical protein